MRDGSHQVCGWRQMLRVLREAVTIGRQATMRDRLGAGPQCQVGADEKKTDHDRSFVLCSEDRERATACASLV